MPNHGFEQQPGGQPENEWSLKCVPDKSVCKVQLTIYMVSRRGPFGQLKKNSFVCCICWRVEVPLGKLKKTLLKMILPVVTLRIPVDFETKNIL